MEGFSEREDVGVVLEMFWLHQSVAGKKHVETNPKAGEVQVPGGKDWRTGGMKVRHQERGSNAEK